MATLTVTTPSPTVTVTATSATLTVTTRSASLSVVAQVPVANLFMVADWHTTSAWPTRPTTSGLVEWVGPASASQPSGMLTYDTWRVTPT